MVNDLSYSILMSVYAKEKPDFLRSSIISMLSQTAPSDDFVLVCDGPLTPELDSVINEFKGSLNILKLEKNSGLGNALNEGLKLCRNDLIARMDSDDISMPDRCEKQLEMFAADPDLAVASGQLSEFNEDPDISIGIRSVPLTHEEIMVFARKRNPFNHPCVMFRKAAVEAAGGYKEDYHLFEDYYLWVRMLVGGAHGANHPDVILKMRTVSDTYLRRGGKEYAKELLAFHKWMKKEKFTAGSDYITAIAHAAVCRMPAPIRKKVYKTLR